MVQPAGGKIQQYWVQILPPHFLVTLGRVLWDAAVVCFNWK